MNSPEPFETPARIIEAIDSLLQEAVGRYYDHHSDEMFMCCNVCGKWEGDHMPLCPVPALEAWMNTTPGTPR